MKRGKKKLIKRQTNKNKRQLRYVKFLPGIVLFLVIDCGSSLAGSWEEGGFQMEVQGGQNWNYAFPDAAPIQPEIPEELSWIPEVQQEMIPEKAAEIQSQEQQAWESAYGEEGSWGEPLWEQPSSAEQPSNTEYFLYEQPPDTECPLYEQPLVTEPALYEEPPYAEHSLYEEPSYAEHSGYEQLFYRERSLYEQRPSNAGQLSYEEGSSHMEQSAYEQPLSDRKRSSRERQSLYERDLSSAKALFHEQETFKTDRSQAESVQSSKESRRESGRLSLSLESIKKGVCGIHFHGTVPVSVISFQINGRECYYQWSGTYLVPLLYQKQEMNTVNLLLRTPAGELYSLEESFN